MPDDEIHHHNLIFGEEGSHPESVPPIKDTLNCAAFTGNVEVVKLVISSLEPSLIKVLLSKWTFAYAARGEGNIGCFQFLMEMNCPWDKTVCAAAAAGGELFLIIVSCLLLKHHY